MDGHTSPWMTEELGILRDQARRFFEFKIGRSLLHFFLERRKMGLQVVADIKVLGQVLRRRL